MSFLTYLIDFLKIVGFVLYYIYKTGLPMLTPAGKMTAMNPLRKRWLIRLHVDRCFL